jgi:cyclopropane fatty-acyl-phospholipid synthase-like methyltransferase
MKYSQKDILEYYKLCENAYKDVWHLDTHMAMHLGVWVEEVKTLPQALWKENELLARLGNIKPNDNVLDAGCGVGGSSFWLSKNIGCKTIGISIVPEQVNNATKKAQKLGLESLSSFQLQDYCYTNFENESFDVIWAINSVCYAEPKERFIAEAYRLLKPGGRLLLSDAFQGKEILSADEHKLLYNKTYHGWVVNSLDTSKQFMQKMIGIGFSNTSFIDYSKETMPSVNRLFLYYFPASIYNFFSPLFGKKFTEIQKNNTRIIYHLRQSLKKGLWQYGMIVGEK